MGMKLPPDLERKVLELSAQPTLPPDPKAAEKEFQACVVNEAKRLGWDYYHPTISLRSKKGYPDLTCWRERVVWFELKVHPNKPTAAQLNVMDGLKKAGGEVYCFYPEHWQLILEVLK